MRILVIDTATQAMSLALVEDGVVCAHAHELVGRGHAERLLPAIAALPDGGKADRISVDVGPGSFTGVRIGIAAARALAFAWGVELVGYSALSLIAARAARSGSTTPLTVAITGGHGELFWQRFDPATLVPTTEPTSTPIATLATMIDDPIIYGTGAQALVEARGSGDAVSLYPDAQDYADLPAQAALPPRPLYGRGADAMTLAQRQATSG